MATPASRSRPRPRRSQFDNSIQSFEREAAALERQLFNASTKTIEQASRQRKA